MRTERQKGSVRFLPPDTPIGCVGRQFPAYAVRVLKIDFDLVRLALWRPIRTNRIVQSSAVLPEGDTHKMNGGTRWRMRTEVLRWPDIRPAAMYLATGTSLTLGTMVLCISNSISAQQAIALALLAVMTTLGGWIGLIVPDAWIAWRRGFQQGCKAAMGSQAPHPAAPAADPAAHAAADTIPPGSGEPTVTELLPRGGTRSGRRTQSWR
jgi:hypothetical protein